MFITFLKTDGKSILRSLSRRRERPPASISIIIFTHVFKIIRHSFKRSKNLFSQRSIYSPTVIKMNPSAGYRLFASSKRRQLITISPAWSAVIPFVKPSDTMPGGRAYSRQCWSAFIIILLMKWPSDIWVLSRMIGIRYFRRSYSEQKVTQYQVCYTYGQYFQNTANYKEIIDSRRNGYAEIIGERWRVSDDRRRCEDCILGSSGGQTRIMIDAPKDVNIVRSKAIENGSRIRSFWRRSRSITRIRKAPPRRKIQRRDRTEQITLGTVGQKLANNAES